MTLKKAPSGKRAVLPRASDRTKAFVKDWTRLSHSGRYDMKRLKQAMLLLTAYDAPLGAEWLDHALAGDWADHRECHVGGDFLLIYRLDGSGASSRSSLCGQVLMPSCSNKNISVNSKLLSRAARHAVTG